MRKKVAGLAVVLLVLVAAGGISFWWLMEQPFYEPGMVRSGKNLRGSLVPPKQTAEGPYWLAEADIRLFYHVQGTGRPVIVLHGGPGYPIHQPLAAVEPLARDYQFYYYDQRGCGRSTRPFDRFESQNFYGNMKELERTLGIGAQVGDIERVRNILGQEKLILMGHSFGAFLAAMYAAEFPERIEALVLVAPAGVLVIPDTEGGLFEEIRVHLPDDQRDGYDRFLKEYLDFGQVFSKSEEDLAKLNRRFGEYFLATAGERVLAAAEDPQDNGGWMVQAMYFSMGKRHDYRAALRAVQAPVLVLHGEDDLVPERVSRMYADAFPNATLRLIHHDKASGGRRAGHFLLNDPPAQLTEEIRQFLGDTRR